MGIRERYLLEVPDDAAVVIGRKGLETIGIKEAKKYVLERVGLVFRAIHKGIIRNEGVVLYVQNKFYSAHIPKIRVKTKEVYFGGNTRLGRDNPLETIFYFPRQNRAFIPLSDNPGLRDTLPFRDDSISGLHLNIPFQQSGWTHNETIYTTKKDKNGEMIDVGLWPELERVTPTSPLGYYGFIFSLGSAADVLRRFRAADETLYGSMKLPEDLTQATDEDVRRALRGMRARDLNVKHIDERVWPETATEFHFIDDLFCKGEGKEYFEIVTCRPMGILNESGIAFMRTANSYKGWMCSEY